VGQVVPDAGATPASAWQQVEKGWARRRDAGLVRLQTVPQEFVALVHGLLGCQAIESSRGWLDHGKLRT